MFSAAATAWFPTWSFRSCSAATCGRDASPSMTGSGRASATSSARERRPESAARARARGGGDRGSGGGGRTRGSATALRAARGPESLRGVARKGVRAAAGAQEPRASRDDRLPLRGRSTRQARSLVETSPGEALRACRDGALPGQGLRPGSGFSLRVERRLDPAAVAADGTVELSFGQERREGRDR